MQTKAVRRSRNKSNELLGRDGKLADPSVYGKKVVKIVFRSKFLEQEKEFLVPEKRMKNIFKVIEIVNVTKERIKITFKGISSVASRASVIVKNLRKKR